MINPSIHFELTNTLHISLSYVRYYGVIVVWAFWEQVSFKKEVGVMVIDLVFWLTVCLILKMCY